MTAQVTLIIVCKLEELRKDTALSRIALATTKQLLKSYEDGDTCMTMSEMIGRLITLSVVSYTRVIKQCFK